MKNKLIPHVRSSLLSQLSLDSNRRSFQEMIHWIHSFTYKSEVFCFHCIWHHTFSPNEALRCRRHHLHDLHLNQFSPPLSIHHFQLCIRRSSCLWSNYRSTPFGMKAQQAKDKSSNISSHIRLSKHSFPFRSICMDSSWLNFRELSSEKGKKMLQRAVLGKCFRGDNIRWDQFARLDSDFIESFLLGSQQKSCLAIDLMEWAKVVT